MRLQKFLSKLSNQKREGVTFIEPWKDDGSELSSDHIRNALSQSFDLKFRKVLIGNNPELPATIIFIEGLINKEQISDYILKPLMNQELFGRADALSEVFELIERGAVYFADQDIVQDIKDAIDRLLSGHSLLVFDGLKKAIAFNTKGFIKRGITEPTSENVTKGAKDCFVETLKVNTASIRRKIKSPYLTFEEQKIGRQTETSVVLVFMNNIANDNLVDAIRKKLLAIQTDGVLSTGVIEEQLMSNINSVFPQVKTTERPDTFCADLLEGRVGVLVDGLPFTFIVPGSFVQFLQAPEDYARNYIISSVIRLMRYFLLLATLIIPAFYIAITNFHPELLPTDLVISIAEAKMGVPFTAPVETIIMLVAFELIFEAGLRMPSNVGSTVTIVGALIVGEAAVRAKFLSAPVVIVIAFTAISSFAMPSQDLSNALRLWRLGLAIGATVLGLFGLSIGVLILLYHLCKLENFGVPYLEPLESSKATSDTLLRFPLKSMKQRPEELRIKNAKR